MNATLKLRDPARGLTAPAVFATCLIAILMTTAGCKKTDEAAKAAVGAAGAEAAAAAGAEAAAAAAAAAASAAAEVDAKVAPPQPDIALEAGDKVIAWFTLRSIGAAFDLTETLATRFGVAPPGASLRQGAYDDLTKMLAGAGITGHEWLDKSQPVHVIFQDDNPDSPAEGAAVILPVTDPAKALDAFAAAKKGAEAEGHSAIIEVGSQRIFVDVLEKTLVVSTSTKRFGMVKAFASRLVKLEPPALAYFGVSVKDAVVTRKAQLDGLFAQMDAIGEGGAGEPGSAAALDYYGKLMREWTASLQRVEFLIDATAEDLQLGMRMHLVEGSDLARQVDSSRGRLAIPLAASLPANAYLAAVASLDPKASLKQLDDSLKMLGDIMKLDAAVTAGLKDDLRGAIEQQSGDSGFAAYPDGDAAIGALGYAGVRDPAAALKLFKKFVSVLALKAIEAEEARALADDPKSKPEPYTAIVKKAIAEMRVDPLIESFGGMAKEAGVTITANTTNADGIACDVTDLSFDWAKIQAASGDDEVGRAAKVIGPRTAMALCTGKDRVVVTLGPSAFEQGRRSAAGKTGGLGDAPVFKGAAERTVDRPIWFLYLNAGAAAAALGTAFPEANAMGLPADRAVAVGCGHRAKSYNCELDVPMGLIQAAYKASRGGPPGAP